MKRLILTIGTVLFLTASLLAQDLISVNDLNTAIRKKEVIAVDARSDAKYKADAHIRNAVHVSYKDLQKSSNVKGELISTSQIAAILGKNGISADKPIVVYDGGSAKYAGRLYWILKYTGAENVRMLDGNLKAWKAKRKPITKNPTMARKTRFNASVDKSIIATMADVKKGSAALIDVRSAAEYNGSDKKSKGHIPGAINIEFKKVLDGNGKLKNNAAISQLFSKVGGKNKEIILYCGSSVRAGVVFLALKGAGYTNVKVYDGAYYEWESAGNKIVQ